jgi:hypothetical protein
MPESTLLNLGTFSLAPATVDTTTFDIQGNISGAVAFLPGNIPLLGSARSVVESYLGLAPGTIPAALDFDKDFAYSLSLPSDPAQFEDGDITLDLPLVSSLYGFTPTTPIQEVLDDFNIDISQPIPQVLDDFNIALPDSVQEILDVLEINTAEDAVGVLDDLFNLQLGGTGTFTSATQSTDFNFEYSNDTNALVVDGFDPDVLSLGLEQTSTISAEGTFGVDLVLSQFLRYSQLLDIDLPSNLATGIFFLQRFGGTDAFTLASGSFNLEYTATPVSDSLTSSTAEVLSFPSPVMFDVA